MPRKNSLMNILCFGLPAEITQPACKEYDWRWAEIQRIWSNPENNYSLLQPYETTVENLLATSLFMKYVLGGLYGADDFFVRLNKQNQSGECPVKIGSYVLDLKARNHLLAIKISFDKLIHKYQLTSEFFTYSETIEFLRNCIDLFRTQEREIDDTI